MADRQWFVNGVQVYETGEEEYTAQGVQVNEDQPAAAVDPDTSGIPMPIRRRSINHLVGR